MSTNPLENSVELRECLKNGTLSLRDLDNKQKRRSSKGRRRRSKTKTGRTEEAADGGETRAKAMEDPEHSKKEPKVIKPSRTKKVPKGSDVHVGMINQHKDSDEETVRSLLNEALDTVVRQCIAIEHSQAKEQRNVVSTVDFQRSAELDGRMRAHMEQMKAEKLAMQQIMYKTASEVVQDLFSSAANNASKTEGTGDGDTTKTETMEDPTNIANASEVTKSSRSKTGLTGSDVHLKMRTQHKESGEIARSILDDVLDTVTRQCIANEQSIENERALMLVLGCVAAFDDMNQFTRKLYVDERRETQELLYREAKEKVKNLLRSTDYNARMRVQVKQINTEKRARKEIVYKAASETIEDLFSCAANNAGVQNVIETELTNDEETDCELPVRGWRRFVCCGQTYKLKVKIIQSDNVQCVLCNPDTWI
ncbi:uncharacterized protein LOC134282924 [Saccostrea cucullata]|uniref:uncharacterized protein LOC134282924 n=1 Tax=Saccostrea cuccullata TaxID=36930 RepID=UPI002ED197AF